MNNIKLSNGVLIPQIGLGTFRSKDEDAYNAVLHALKIGYRHIDTAAIYGNEEQVGKAIKDSLVPREEIFITTKLWNSDQGYESAKEALKKSLERLDLDYIDLYLIHWPQTYQKAADSWKYMEEALNEGLVRSIGVSNFNIHHIEHLLLTANVKPMVNQVECHIGLQNHKLQQFCSSHNIYLEAYAPLMSHHVSELISNETLINIGDKYNKTPAQVAIKWLLQRDIIALPKSITLHRIEDNFNVFDFELKENDMDEIRKLNNARKIFPEPDNIDF